WRLMRLLARPDLRFLGELRRVSSSRPIYFEWFAALPAWVAQSSYPSGMLFYWEPGNPVLQDKQGRAQDDDAMFAQQHAFWKQAYRQLKPDLSTDCMLRVLLFQTHRLQAIANFHSWRWRTAMLELKYALLLRPKHRAMKALKQKLTQHLGPKDDDHDEK
ncbi:MAG: hypothetical protein AAGJ35_14225, partial [Myxococcota bacterium]